MLYNSNAFLSKVRTYVSRNHSYRHGHRHGHRHCHRSRSSNSELQHWVRYCLLPRAVECPGMTMTDRLDALQKVAFLDGLGMDCNAGPSTFNGHIDRRSAIASIISWGRHFWARPDRANRIFLYARVWNINEAGRQGQYQQDRLDFQIHLSISEPRRFL